MNPGVSLEQQGIVLASHALQRKAELVMLLHFGLLLAKRKHHKLVQEGFPARLPIIAQVLRMRLPVARVYLGHSSPSPLPSQMRSGCGWVDTLLVSRKMPGAL